MPAHLRPFHPSDLPALYRICLLTGDAGSDATSLYRDPDLLGHLYAGPYPLADPSLTFVVVDEYGVGGYVVATADTLAFQRWCEAHWWPTIRGEHPQVGDPRDGTRDHQLLHEVHAAPAPVEAYDSYPAHLHIDLLPHLQGRGWGRTLITTLAEALRARGVPGVQLGVSEANQNAIAFYGRLGFSEVARHPWGRTLGLRL